jgi:CheY-like chemotaxis protein
MLLGILYAFGIDGKGGEAVKVVLMVVDDEIVAPFLMQLLIQNTPHYVVHVRNYGEACEVTADVVPDVVLIDYVFPKFNGINLYEKLSIRRRMADVPTLILRVPVEESDLHQELDKRFVMALDHFFDLVTLPDLVISMLKDAV